MSDFDFDVNSSIVQIAQYFRKKKSHLLTLLNFFKGKVSKLQ